LAQWRLPGRFTRGVSRVLAGALVGVFVLAFALAFVPYGVTPAKGPLPQASSTPGTPGSITPQADGDWLAYGRGYDALRYTPLAQIDRSNVHRLERAWVFHTGDLPDKSWGAETTPLKVGDTLYLCSARNILFALDARTGEQKWKYDPQVSDEYIPYTAACRGVAHYTVATTAGDATGTADATCATRIVEGTLDGRLVVVDARTGLPCAGFGDNGQVS